jgi:hypothetical protein
MYELGLNTTEFQKSFFIGEGEFSKIVISPCKTFVVAAGREIIMLYDTKTYQSFWKHKMNDQNVKLDQL